MRFRSGQFDRTIDITSDTGSTSNDHNEPVESFTNLVTGEPAMVAFKKGKETFKQGQEVAQYDRTFTIRWRSGLDETMRIVFESETYDILSIMESERRKYLKIEARKKDNAAV